MVSNAKNVLRWCIPLLAIVVAVTPVHAEPFQGQPITIPGRIDLENYDTGGEGIAYFDRSPGNSYGAYRNDDVDIASGNNNVIYLADTQAGEWLQYSVNLTLRIDTIAVAVASLGEGGSFHLEFHGPSGNPFITDPIQIPDTGGWQNWRLIRIPIPFGPEVGASTLRVMLDTNGASGYVGSIDYMQLSAGSQASSANAFVTGNRVAGTIQAEHYDNGGENAAYHDSTPGNSSGAYRNDDVDILQGQDDTYYLADTKASEWLTYSVYRDPGSYRAQLRVASAGPGGTLHIEVNGSDVTGPIQIPDTGGWQNWTMVTAPMAWSSSGEGYTTLRLVLDSDGPTGYVGSIDFIRFMYEGQTQHAYANEEAWVPRGVAAWQYDQGGEGVAYHDTTEGNRYGQGRHEDVDVALAADGRYYVAETKAGEWMEYSVVAVIGEAFDAVIELEAASNGEGGVVHVEVDGVDVTGPMRLADTGGWQAFQTQRADRTFRLTRFGHRIRLSFDEDGPSGYVGSIRFIGVRSAAP